MLNYLKSETKKPSTAQESRVCRCSWFW